MKERKRIVALGLYIPGIGFTRVFDSLFAHLGKTFEIHWIGIAYKGPVVTTEAYTLYPNNLQGGDMYGTYASHQLAKSLGADFVLLIQDAWMLHNYRRIHAEQSWKTIAYVPLDGDITDPSDIIDISWLDHVVAYHRDAAEQFTRALHTLLVDGKISTAPAVHHIYHGVDTKVFTPTAQREEIKQKIFGHLPEWETTCFLLNANRFADRKDIYATLKGFAVARSSAHRQLCLCLHMPALETGQSHTLHQWLAELGLENAVIINPLDRTGYADENTLAQLYQACDLGINTSLGEGWGLIAFEHAACGGAQILPGQRGQREIWKDAAAFIDLSEPVRLRSNPFLMYQVSTSHLAQLIVHYSEDHNALQAMQKQAYDHASGSAFQWEELALQWTTLLEDALVTASADQ
jgi:glycosyltransferase involved in cell wall biosynthesis